MINLLFSLAGFDPLHAAAAVVQHDVYWRGGGGGVLQHGGGAAPQEARHQPGPWLPRALQIPDPGETAPERLQREVRAVAGLELCSCDPGKKQHYSDYSPEVILPDQFFLSLKLNFPIHLAGSTSKLCISFISWTDLLSPLLQSCCCAGSSGQSQPKIGLESGIHLLQSFSFNTSHFHALLSYAFNRRHFIVINNQNNTLYLLHTSTTYI